MRLHPAWLVCSALGVLAASAVAAQSTRSLEGRWEGTLPVDAPRGSRELGRRDPPPSPVYFVISTASDGKYAGLFWLNRGASRPADIGDVALEGDAVRIGVPDSRGVWEGKLSPDGSTLTGEWRQSGKTTPLVLRRTGSADEPVRIQSHSQGTVIQR